MQEANGYNFQAGPSQSGSRNLKHKRGIVKRLPQGGGEDQLSGKTSNLDKSDNLASAELSVSIKYGYPDGLLNLPSCYVGAKFRSSDDG